ncbi:hypothetical protein VTN00DRAFT_6625 [Thermoascus crustaceus]|uniref:uncharacterized protein n=1 Tax=Thermoascus crustaceus TaxID=5088 RepID=UPI003744A2D3
MIRGLCSRFLRHRINQPIMTDILTDLHEDERMHLTNPKKKETKEVSGRRYSASWLVEVISLSKVISGLFLSIFFHIFFSSGVPGHTEQTGGRERERKKFII